MKESIFEVNWYEMEFRGLQSVYHQVIEALRREIEFGVRAPDSVRAEICEIVEEGSVYYEDLLDQLQGLNGFKLDDILLSEQPHVLGSVSSMKVSWLFMQDTYRPFLQERYGFPVNATSEPFMPKRSVANC